MSRDTLDLDTLEALVRHGLDECEDCPASTDGSCLRVFVDPASDDYLRNQCEVAVDTIIATIREKDAELVALREEHDQLERYLNGEFNFTDLASAHQTSRNLKGAPHAD